MGIFDDYINGLEGKEELDPMAIARDLSELHSQEIETHTAKIGELETSVADRDGLIAERDNDLRKQKALNFDLAMQIPGANNQENQSADTGNTDPAAITIDDLFVK